MRSEDFTDAEIRECIEAGYAAWGRPLPSTWNNGDNARSVRRLLAGEAPTHTHEATPRIQEAIRACAASILARRAPKRERLGPWIPCPHWGSGWSRLRADGEIGARVCDGDFSWRVVDPYGIAHQSNEYGFTTHGATSESAKLAADTAARAIYDLDEPELIIKAGDLVRDIHGHEHGFAARDFRIGELVTTVPVYYPPKSTEGAVTGRPAYPPDRLRPALDALLRFVLGQPDGEQWMGKERWGNVAATGNLYARDGIIRPEGKELEGEARHLLALLNSIPGHVTARWLGIEEQREYNRLFAAVKGAL